MKRMIVICSGISVLILTVALVSGCTVIGFGLGSYMDSKADGTNYAFQNGLDSLDFKDELLITLKDGSVNKGRFSGVSAVSNEEFDSFYTQLCFENRNNIFLPAIGDTLTIHLKPSRSKEYKVRLFDGFTFKSFDSGNQTFLKVRYIKTGANEYIDMRGIHKITDFEGEEINLKSLNNFIHSGGLNNLTTLILMDKYTRLNIRMVDIQNIKVAPKQRAAPVFTGLGLVLDIAILAIIRPAPENSSSRRSTGNGT